MATATAEPTVLDTLKARRAEISTEWDKLIDERETARAAFDERMESDEKPSDEDRDAEKAADEEFRGASLEMERQFNELDERIKLLEGKAQRRQLAAENTIDAEVVSEPMVYRRDNAHETSYFKDLCATDRTIRGSVSRDWSAAEERLHRHGKMMEETVAAREEKAQRDAESKVDSAEREFRRSMGINDALTESPFEKRQFEQRVNPSRGPGAGGEFVPPLWLVEDDFIPALRAGRVIAPLCRNMPVPPGTDTIKLPKIKLGTEVAPQIADNAGVASRDIESEYVEAAVKTLAGQEDVAIQLIEQSPGQVFDRVVQEDLLADYNLKVEQNVSFGKGENYTTLNAGTIRGLFPGTEWGAGVRKSTTALTEGPLVLMSGLNANWSHIAKERFDTSDVHHVINPAFGAYLASAGDGSEGKTGRMFSEATSFSNFNAGVLTPPVNPAQGYFGNTPLGPNIYISANIPPILPQAETAKGEQAKMLFAANEEAKALLSGGSATGFSYGLTAKFDDVWFFESDLRARVLPEVVSGTLQIRFQVYAYVALLVRYGPSLQFCGGKPFEVGAMNAAPAKPALGGYAF